MDLRTKTADDVVGTFNCVWQKDDCTGKACKEHVANSQWSIFRYSNDVWDDASAWKYRFTSPQSR